MGYVFLGYAHKDRAFVDSLASRLRDAGVEVWVDIQELEAGVNFADAIGKAISEADAYVTVVSEHSIKSSWVLTEIEFADSFDKTIVPIILKHSEPLQLPLPLTIRPRDYVEAKEKQLDEIINELIDVLPISVKQKDPIAQKEDKSKGYVFVSSVEEDLDFVERLISHFSEKGYGYWDYLHSDREYQLAFHLELENAISKAAATICVISPDWKKSIWTPKEYLFSEQVKIPTLVLRYRDVGPTLLIADRTYIDFTKDEKAGFMKLDRELKRRGLT